MWIFIILGLLFIGFLSFLQSPKGKGIVGEWRVNHILKKLAIEYGGIELNDFMFEDNISSSQIDNMLLTQKALYVIEVKNYTGHIFGSEEQLNWTVTVKHVNKKKNRSGKVYKKTHISKHKFYNPLKQNKTHINKIKNLTTIHNSIPVFNIVVFGKNAYIRDVTHSDKVFVLHQDELIKTIRNLDNDINNVMNNESQIEIVDTLHEINIGDKKRRKQHVKDLKKKHT